MSDYIVDVVMLEEEIKRLQAENDILKMKISALKELLRSEEEYD